MADVINIEILEDGTISAKTGEVSDTNHFSADELMKMVDSLMGGKVVITPNKDAERASHAHSHSHQHGHAHAGGHHH